MSPLATRIKATLLGTGPSRNFAPSPLLNAALRLHNPTGPLPRNAWQDPALREQFFLRNMRQQQMANALQSRAAAVNAQAAGVPQ